MRPVDASDSSHTLEELLSQPNSESWRAIIEMGKPIFRSFVGAASVHALQADADRKSAFKDQVSIAVKHWPPEIERLCPASWPADFRSAIEHRVRETDTYGHYLARICGHPDLKLSDGSQAVWLERRYTGGIVEVSTVKSALRLLAAALAAPSVQVVYTRIKDAVRLLAGGTRNVGKVGCADLTGGLTIPTWIPDPHPAPSRQLKNVEYRLEVEVKVGDEPQRPEQVARMESVRRRGGCYVLATSVESAVAQILAFSASH